MNDFLGLEGCQAGSDFSFSTDCMLCCIVVRKEQRTIITVENSPPNNILHLGILGPHQCTALSEVEA